MTTILAGAMLVGFLAGLALALSWPVPDTHVDLPADHPLQVLPGTRIIDRGEFR